MLERLATRQASNRELAEVLGIAESSLRALLRRDPNFRADLERARELGKAQLRCRQWDVAMSGDVTMLLWLGRQYLGQSDQSCVEFDEAGGGSRERLGILLEELAKRTGDRAMLAPRFTDVP